MIRSFRKNSAPRAVDIRLSLVRVLMLAIALAGSADARGRTFTATEAAAVFKAHLDAFYYTNAAGSFFRDTNGGTKSDFWKAAEQMEMVLDVYERSRQPFALTVFSNAYTGFVSQHGDTWQKNPFNDDIMWMVIACARAHQFTGNPEFREAARRNFDLCFARAWSTNLGGGLWWKTANRSKNACVNGPAAIAAFLLYQIYGDTNYLAKSRAAYDWERKILFEAATGRVYDNINATGRIGRIAFTYNQGTFIGAANFLGETNDARLAAEYTRDHLCRDGLLPDYNQDGDAAGFNGIFLRWLGCFLRERGLQTQYRDWLQANAEAAWQGRRASDGLAWSRWHEPTPEGKLYSWACSSSVVLFQQLRE